MATVKFVLYKSNKRKDGSYPVCLRVTKKGKLKYIDLNLSAFDGGMRRLAALRMISVSILIMNYIMGC